MRNAALLTLALLAAPCAAAPSTPAAPAAMPPGHPPVGEAAREKPSAWAVLGDYRLSVKVPPGGETATWTFHTFDDPSDVLIELDTPGAKTRTKGALLLLGGSLMAARGFTPEKGFEVDALDVAVLNLKILTRLLDIAVPEGPSKLFGTRTVKAEGRAEPILAFTPSATAKFAAPWTLTGTVSRPDLKDIDFALTVEEPGDKPGTRRRWSFTGRASGSPIGRQLDGNMSLAGWKAYRLGGPDPAKGKAHAALRFGATLLDGPFATLKDLRAAQR